MADINGDIAAGDVEIIDGISGNKAEVTANNELKVVTSGTVYLPPFVPRTINNFSNITISSNTIYDFVNILGSGQLDFIDIRMNTDAYDIILTIDGVIVYDLSFLNLKNLLKVDINANDDGGSDIKVNGQDKTFRELYRTPINFLTSLKISIRNTAVGNKKLKAFLVRYRIVT